MRTKINYSARIAFHIGALPALMISGYMFILSVMCLGLFLTQPVQANEGPHGSYTLSTANCAGCHRPHTATGNKLLRGDAVDTTIGNGTNYDIADFCFSCHKDGVGANNNVYAGYYMGYAGPGDAGTSTDATSNPWPFESTNTAQLGTRNAGLNGGGFNSAKVYWGSPQKMTYNGRTKRGVDWTDPVGGTHFNHTATGESAVSSYHNALDDTRSWTVWGSLMAGSTAATAKGPGMIVTLKCTSCHDQHGSAHYRILRDSRSDQRISSLIPGFVEQLDHYGADMTTNYPETSRRIMSWEKEFSGVNALTKDYTSYAYKASADLGGTLSDFCRRCHSQYYAVGWIAYSYAPYDAGDGLGQISRWRHQTAWFLAACPGKCPNQVCGAYNLNRWVQLPLAVRAGAAPGGATDGKISGRPVYEADLHGSMIMVCTTCHQAHGTASNVVADAQVGPTRIAQGSDPGHTNLLRMDNRGICEDCHGWSPQKDENGVPCSRQYDPTSCVDPIGP